MKTRISVLHLLTAITSLLVLSGPAGAGEQPDAFAWPTLSRECKPWAYWWWLGSAVDETNLTRELIRYHDVGLGGVHIIPIYGAKGCESRYIDYLSPAWMQRLGYTVTEAQKLDLGVDMTTGTGWCFGGPTVSENDASAGVVLKTNSVSAGTALREKYNRQSTQALVAYSRDGKKLDITDRIQADGTVDWHPDAGDWTLYAISQKANSRVKRAAPGGEGYMLNPAYLDAIQNYLKRFTKAFADYQGPKPRAMYHDSFEYGVNWSPDLFRQFEKRRGYPLQLELPALLSTNPDDTAARVKSDYRETISDMMTDNFVPVWTRWAHKVGFITRNQAHGSPGNLLDLYAAADIPETEMFHLDRRPLIAKFASSAAHVAGHPLTSAETGTWLKEHFTETLGDLKALMDDMFVSGINHVFYHGTCYSPDDAGWPGWLFYASTEMNPRNAFWHDVYALNAYIARCQAVLQSGAPDNDILVYWPIYDQWHNAKGLGQNLTIHGGSWFSGQPIGSTASNLWSRGFTFDYISDRQLIASKTTKGLIKTAGATYQVILVPPCDHMPTATLEQLLNLAKRGATVIFQDHLPADVPGLASLEKRREILKHDLSIITPVSVGNTTLREARLGKGRILIGELDSTLAAAGVKREPVVDVKGVAFIRRSFKDGHFYFIVNNGDQPLDTWVTLATKVSSVILMDALNNKTGKGSARKTSTGDSRVYLQLQAGESVILKTLTTEIEGPSWNYVKASAPSLPLPGTWQIKFIQGGPALPGSLETTNLESWTTLGGDEAKRFAGTALYSLHFDIPDHPAEKWMLDLGHVCESARVRLNGQEIGTLIKPPYRVIASPLKPSGNLLEVEVTNLSANRIRDLDIKRVQWKNFNDINFVNIDYKPFNASTWPLMKSGLLGPVTMTPMSTVRPE